MQGGGGVGNVRKQKGFGGFCVCIFFCFFWGGGGGGVDQIQKFLGTFYPDFGEIRHKKCPKSSKKKISLRKSAPKVPKVWGGGQTCFGRIP